MNLPLMPKATAVWLVENTALTFRQIAAFCGLHELEVKGIADGEVAVGIVGLDPVANGQLTQDEIDRCTADPAADLHLRETTVPVRRRHAKGPRYTPVSKRQDRPNAISWLLRNHPELTDAQIQKMLGTTKNTINQVRERTHWNMVNIKPQDPVGLGLCTQEELNEAVEKALQREERRAKREAKAAATPAAPPAPPVEPPAEPTAEPTTADPAPVGADEETTGS